MIKLIAPYRLENIENSTLQEVVDYCVKKDIIVIDTETRPKPQFKRYKKAGLDPYMSEIVMFQIGDQYQQFVIDTRFVDITGSSLLDVITNPDIKKILVNGKFDYKMIYTNYGVRINNIHDLMVQEMSLYQGIQGKGFSLEKMTMRYLGTEFRGDAQLDLFSDNKKEEEMLVSKATRKEFFYIQDSPFSINQVKYGSKDIELPALIYPLQLQLLKKETSQKLVDLENNYTLVLADMELTGFHVDKERWVNLYNQNEIKRQHALSVLQEYVRKHDSLKGFMNPQTSLFKDSNDLDVSLNWASSKQFIELCKALGIPTKILDKKKSKDSDDQVYKDSVEEAILSKYKSRFDIIEPYLTFRRFEKATSTYGISFLDQHLHPTTKNVHSTYRQILASGRTASRDPNLQNIPNEQRVPGFRECFRAVKGSKLVVGDYSGQELRILAEYANEKTMIDALNAGDDLHSITASKVYSIIRGELVNVSKTENPDLRAHGKTLNFGIAYGMSAHKLSNDFGVSLEEADKIIKAFYESYPNLSQYFDRVKEEALTLGYITIDPKIKRKSHLGTYWEQYVRSKLTIEAYKDIGKPVPKRVLSDYYLYKGMIERKAQNYPIQGTGANISKFAACILRKYQEDNNQWGLFSIVNMVHDELVLQTTEENADEVKNILERAMLKAGDFFCTKCPMVVEAVISDHWNH